MPVESFLRALCKPICSAILRTSVFGISPSGKRTFANCVWVKRCKKCDLGAYEVKSGKNGNFFGCHLWISTGCRGSETLSDVSKPTKEPAIRSEIKSSQVTSVVERSVVEPSVVDRSGKKWKLEEDLLALSLFTNGRGLEEIAIHLGRKATAIQGRFVRWIEMADPRLQIQITKKSVEYDNYENVWTESERVELLRFWKESLDLVEITEKLQRPKHQIIAKLFEMDVFVFGQEHISSVKYHHLEKKT